MPIRPATHAGSWYESRTEQLRRKVSAWLAGPEPEPSLPNPWTSTAAPSGATFAVGPHAGYAYCGRVLGQTYAALAERPVIFVMGPSHYEYFRGVRTTRFDEYETPLGSLKCATDIIGKLREGGVRSLSEATELEEHSIEMHCPFIAARFPKAKIVPLVFGHMAEEHSVELIQLLSLYFNEAAFVVSSDFCHWGQRFDYVSVWDSQKGFSQTFTKSTEAIWQGIKNLDFKAMEVASTGSAEKWQGYIDDTGNTICGQTPFGFLLALGEHLGHPLEFKWLAYDQSSPVTSPTQSSVSYASGIAM